MASAPSERAATPRQRTFASGGLAGVLLAIAGVGALFADSLRLDAGKIVPMLAIVASTVCAAMAALATKKHGAALHPAALNAPAIVVGGALLAAVSLIAGDGAGVGPHRGRGRACAARAPSEGTCDAGAPHRAPVKALTAAWAARLSSGNRRPFKERSTRAAGPR